MSRVFMLSSNVAKEPYPVYPLGMAIIAGVLEQQGHAVQQYDFLVHDQSIDKLVAALRQFNPEIVALSLRNIDNVDSFSSDENWYLSDAKELISTIKETVVAKVIVGGPAFSIMPEAIIDYLQADYGVVGEGEEVVGALVAAIERGDEIGRLHSGAAALAGEQMQGPLLVPEYVEFYQQHSGMVNLQTKRGCPYRCVYCTYPGLEGNCFRPREVGAVVDEIEKMQRDHAVDHIFFTDSIFNDSKGHHLQLAEEIVRREVTIEWCAFFRPQGLTAESLVLLKRSGLYAMEMGTDAGCDRTLAGLNKGFTFAEVQRCHQLAIAAEIPCAHFIMFGGPEETPDTLREGLANVKTLDHAVVFAFSGIRILPNASIMHRAIADGIMSADTDLLKPLYYVSPHIDQQWMNEEISKSFAGTREHIFPPSDGQALMTTMNNFGFKGILWDQMVRFSAPARRRRRARRNG